MVIPSMIVTVVIRLVSFCNRYWDLRVLPFVLIFTGGSLPVEVDQINPVCNINRPLFPPPLDDPPALQIKFQVKEMFLAVLKPPILIMLCHHLYLQDSKLN